jgi:uncharacterized protein YegP (UPF0339 family)
MEKDTKFEIRRNCRGQYYWKFVAANGKDICWSESYHNKQDAVSAMELMKENAKTAVVTDRS